MNNTLTEGGALVRVKMVTREFAMSHTTNRMNEAAAVQIFEPVLVRVVGVGAAVEVERQRIFPTFLVMSVLSNIQYTCNLEQEGDLHDNPPH